MNFFFKCLTKRVCRHNNLCGNQYLRNGGQTRDSLDHEIVAGKGSRFVKAKDLHLARERDPAPLFTYKRYKTGI